MTAIEGKDVEFKQIKELESKDLSEETLSVIYSGLMKLLRSALKLPLESLKQEVSTSDVIIVFFYIYSSHVTMQCHPMRRSKENT